MIHLGVLDDDESLVTAMREMWEREMTVDLLRVGNSIPEGLDVLIVDLESLGGRALRFVHEIRERRPSLRLVLTYVYCDQTQPLEERVQELADLCVLKPFDLEKLAQSLRFLVETPGDRVLGAEGS